MDTLQTTINPSTLTTAVASGNRTNITSNGKDGNHVNH